MMEGKNDDLSSHLRWFQNRKNTNPKRSSWLQSAISELDEKTQAMLKLIEEDADSFAKRAEMYYKKRPQLVDMVGDFYRTHRSLAERFDQARQRSEKSTAGSEKSYDSFSEQSEESEVSDPEQEEESQLRKEKEREEAPPPPPLIASLEDEVRRLRAETERLREENEIQKMQLTQKDEEKREVIRQLCSSMDSMREENMNMKMMRKNCCLKMEKEKQSLPWKKLFSVSSSRSQPSLFGLFLFRV